MSLYDARFQVSVHRTWADYKTDHVEYALIRHKEDVDVRPVAGVLEYKIEPFEDAYDMQDDEHWPSRAGPW